MGSVSSLSEDSSSRLGQLWDWGDSKWPFEKVEVFETTESVPSLAITFDQLWFIAKHHLPPKDAEGFRERNRQLDDLAQRVGDADSTVDSPTLVVGDLKLMPWSPIFTSFEVASGLRRAVTKGGGFTPTWYARTDYPWWPFGLALDHVLISSDLRFVSYHVDSHVGSDHRPVSPGS